MTIKPSLQSNFFMLTLTYEHPLIWQPVKIYYIYEYHSYWCYYGNEKFKNTDFNSVDRDILDLKRNLPHVIYKFYKKLLSIFDCFDDIDKFNFTARPSHDSNVDVTSMHIIAQKLSENYNKRDYSQVLQRNSTIPRLSSGGLRNIGVHINSIYINQNFEVKGKNFIILDDIATTGGSMAAAAQILHTGGASEIICLTLAHHKLD